MYYARYRRTYPIRPLDPGPRRGVVPVKLPPPREVTPEERKAKSWPGCPECERYATFCMAPSHCGSTFCQSGSLASGGTRAHCSCDSCF